MSTKPKAKNIGMEMFPLSHNKVTKKAIEGVLIYASIITIIYMGVTLYTNYFDSIDLPNAVAIFIGYLFSVGVVYFLMYLYQTWYFAYYLYDLHGDYMMIKKGPLFPRQTTVPYSKIQDVYIDQDFLDRVFDLYDVHVTVDSSDKRDIHIDGLAQDSSKNMLAFIMKSIHFAARS